MSGYHKNIVIISITSIHTTIIATNPIIIITIFDDNLLIMQHKVIIEDNLLIMLIKLKIMIRDTLIMIVADLLCPVSRGKLSQPPPNTPMASLRSSTSSSAISSSSSPHNCSTIILTLYRQEDLTSPRKETGLEKMRDTHKVSFGLVCNNLSKPNKTKSEMYER